MGERRYPIEALVDKMGGGVKVARLRLRMSGSTYQRYRSRGLTPATADRLAIKVGYHPVQIWPTWIDDALTPLDEVFLAGGWRQAWLWREAGAA